MPNLLQGMGQARPVTDFINTSLKYQEVQSENARREQMTNILKNQAEAQAKQAERDNEWLDVTEVLKKAQESGHGGAINLAIKQQMALGLHKEVTGADETPRTFMRRIDIAGGVDAIGTDAKMQPMILADRENWLTAQIDALDKKKEDPKFAQQYEQMLAERRMVRNKLYGLDESPATKDAGPYTLAPGAQRRGPNNDILAENPKPEDDTKQEMVDLRRDMFEETKRSNRALEAMKKEKQGGTLTFSEKEYIRNMSKQLATKTKPAAETAIKNVQKIDRMLTLINQGAGGVKGELLAKINKVADVLRVTPPEDARYNTLKAELRGFAGTLRLQLGLIGQTSDRDVAIMYEAAGGMSPAESQKAILSGYREGYVQDITTYNSDAEAYNKYSESNLYKTIPLPTAGASSPTVVEVRKTKDGRTLEKLSDGTIREAK